MEITIPRRFCGPPTSGNGGYSCGRLAALLDGPAEVTLRAPPPLDTPLTVQRDGDALRLLQDDREIAHARPQPLDLDVPAPPPWDEARAASARYNGRHDHAYGTCFVCGPQRAPGDGLRIFCGPWRDGLVAGTWTPDSTLDAGDGSVAPEFVWAAIDCPGSWSVIGRTDPEAPLKEMPSTMLLGRLTGRLDRRLAVGEDCTVIGWHLGSEGRKHHVGTAIHTRGGSLVACSRATWIALKSP